MKTGPWALAALLITAGTACSAGGDGSNTGITIPTGAAAGCGATAPVVQALTIEDGGARPTGGETLLARVTANDNDGDLHYYTLRLWWDAVVDGVVDTQEPYNEVYGSLSPTPCATPQATVSMSMVTTGEPPFDTLLDFGVLVYDDEGHASDDGVPYVISYKTPVAP